VHRGVALTNEQQLIMYNKGFGQEFPIGEKKDIDFSLLPEEALFNTDPDPVPLRRSLRGWYNFNEPSGTDRLADSQRYQDLIPGDFVPLSGVQPSSGILPNETIDSFPSSGCVQIRPSGGIGFYDGQPGNEGWWQTNSSQLQPYGYMSYTIAAYVRFPRANIATDICGVWTDTGNLRYWMLAKTAGNIVTFDRANGSLVGQPDTLSVPISNFIAGDWYLIIVRAFMTGSPSAHNYNLRMNVVNLRTLEGNNGQLNGETFHWNTSVPDSSVPFTLGAINTLGTPSVGEVDFGGLGVWYRALTDSELLKFINSGDGINFGSSNFGKISRVYWDSDLKRADDPSTK
jgi:hypothetical protein